MRTLQSAALTVRFLCELGMLAALAYAGFKIGDGATSWVLGTAAPVMAATVWGLFVAPKAKRPVSIPVRLGIEFGLFSVAVIGLILVGEPGLGIVLGVAAGFTSLLNARFSSSAARGPAPGRTSPSPSSSFPARS